MGMGAVQVLHMYGNAVCTNVCWRKFLRNDDCVMVVKIGSCCRKAIFV